MLGPELFVAIPCRSHIPSEVYSAQCAALIKGARYWENATGGKLTLGMTTRSHVDDARTHLANEAMERGSEYVLWMDDDCIPPSNVIELLHQNRLPFVTALFCVRNQPWNHTLIRYGKDGTIPVTPEGQIVIAEIDAEGDLQEIDLCGFHCCMMNIDVLLQVRSLIAEDPSNDRVIFENRALRQDYLFCMRCRVLGIPIYVEVGARCGHLVEQIEHFIPEAGEP